MKRNDTTCREKNGCERRLDDELGGDFADFEDFEDFADFDYDFDEDFEANLEDE